MVWTPLTGIWYFGRLEKRISAQRARSLNSTYWNLVFRAFIVPPRKSQKRSFELHLLESGISGFLYSSSRKRLSLVWTPLTGIWYFGPNPERVGLHRKRVWTPLTGIWYFGPVHNALVMTFGVVWTPLTGIWYFGRVSMQKIRRYTRLNSTYWNLVFRGDGDNRTRDGQEACLNSTYWNLVFRVWFSLPVWTLS